MSNALHRNAADDAWLALPIVERAGMSRVDFTFAFCLGRESTAACYASAELLHRDDPVPDRPFDPDRPKNLSAWRNVNTQRCCELAKAGKTAH